jgi:thiamine biosynthesis protein ThiI
MANTENSNIAQDIHRFSSFIIHYGEIALKKGNRRFFENRLISNIRIATNRFGRCEIRQLPGRINLEFKKPADCNELMKRLSQVFGVANAGPALKSGLSIAEMEDAAKKIITNRTFKSFAVRARRGEKKFPLSSQKVNEEIGAKIQFLTGAKVDLENPDLTIGIEILGREAFVMAGMFSGPGGLPVGISGKVLCLISGGIDSPVAAWRMMKRGCLPFFVHFHSAPFTSAASQEKVVAMTAKLMDAQPHTKLFLVPFGAVQQKIIVSVPSAYRIIFYRRFMMRIAQRLANEIKAQALVTGDALSQVASQTLSNLKTIEAAVDIPVLRPLIGMDKQEIVDEAKRIGSYDIAIEPHDDCCSFLMPRNPVTKTNLQEVNKIEEKLDVEELINLGLGKLKQIDINS